MPLASPYSPVLSKPGHMLAERRSVVSSRSDSSFSRCWSSPSLSPLLSLPFVAQCWRVPLTAGDARERTPNCLFQQIAQASPRPRPTATAAGAALGSVLRDPTLAPPPSRNTGGSAGGGGGSAMLFQVGGQGARPTFFEMSAAQQLPASLRAALTYSLGVTNHPPSHSLPSARLRLDRITEIPCLLRGTPISWLAARIARCGVTH